jgi:heme-degrading monooxygenase HmoA
MHITATQIKIKSISAFFRFFTRIAKIRKQLASAEGVIFVKFSGLRTLTGWQSEDDMKTFRNSGAHLEAMKNIKNIGKAKSISWQADEEPEWHEAKTKLNSIQFKY